MKATDLAEIVYATAKVFLAHIYFASRRAHQAVYVYMFMYEIRSEKEAIVKCVVHFPTKFLAILLKGTTDVFSSPSQSY